MPTTKRNQIKEASLSASLKSFLSTSTNLSARVLSGAVVVAVSAFASNANALPSGGSVEAGSGSATITNPTATSTRITQTTDKVIINWNSFDTSAGETVRFIQPGDTSIALNRITNGQKTIFDGNLQSNGKVWIINPNGMLFNSNASVRVGSLLLSTANISSNNFLNPDTTAGGRKRYTFDQASTDQPNAVITLNGNLINTVVGGTDTSNFNQVKKRGDVILMAPGIALTNADPDRPSAATSVGVDTFGGTFAAASGQTFTVDFGGDGLVNWEAERGVIDLP